MRNRRRSRKNFPQNHLVAKRLDQFSFVRFCLFLKILLVVTAMLFSLFSPVWCLRIADETLNKLSRQIRLQVFLLSLKQRKTNATIFLKRNQNSQPFYLEIAYCKMCAMGTRDNVSHRRHKMNCNSFFCSDLRQVCSMCFVFLISQHYFAKVTRWFLWNIQTSTQQHTHTMFTLFIIMMHTHQVKLIRNFSALDYLYGLNDAEQL